MGLRNLSLSEMAEITSLWLTQERATFQSIPEIAGLLPHVEKAHAQVAALAHPPPHDTDFALLIAHERDLDRRHDHVYRAFYYLGKAWSEYVLSQEKVDDDLLDRVQATIGTLLPQGLGAPHNPFSQEHDDARRVHEAVDRGPGIQRTLSELRLTDSVAAVDILESWFSLAEELGALERRKQELSSPPDANKVTHIRSRTSRNAWMKIVASVMSALEHSSAQDNDIRKLREPLDTAVRRSTLRYIESRKNRRTVA